jgi:hypothetical protein
MATGAMQTVVQTMRSRLSDAATQQRGCEDIYRILYEQESMDVWVRSVFLLRQLSFLLCVLCRGHLISTHATYQFTARGFFWASFVCDRWIWRQRVA